MPRPGAGSEELVPEDDSDSKPLEARFRCDVACIARTKNTLTKNAPLYFPDPQVVKVL